MAPNRAVDEERQRGHGANAACGEIPAIGRPCLRQVVEARDPYYLGAVHPRCDPRESSRLGQTGRHWGDSGPGPGVRGAYRSTAALGQSRAVEVQRFGHALEHALDGGVDRAGR
jgi:hypothetical protein